MAGLDPAISLRQARNITKRDRRDKPGDDNLMRKTFIAAALIAASFGTQPAAADALTFGPDLAGWTVVEFPGIAPVHFTASDNETLAIAADSAAGMLWRPLSGAMRQARVAHWRWRVDDAVAATDLTKRGADDRAIAIYFVFSEQPGAATSPMQTLASPAVTALVYVFGGDKPRGTVIASPHMGERGQFIVLRAADAPKHVWHEESIKLAPDYARAFGRKAPALIGVAISSDSDNTHARNRANVQNLAIGE